MIQKSKFAPDQLRGMINAGRSALEIMSELGIASKLTLKNHVNKLRDLDEKYYKVNGIEGRALTGKLKFTKNGVRLSSTLLSRYGFNQDDQFVFSIDAGKIILTKAEA